ncbi:MAG: DUF1822 family protein [Symploca sp. SIO3E6]|nr:DUF1822 family protein [Caldora sp. SIO3E6]
MEPVIPLEPEDYTQALEISKRVTYQEQRWQAYLNMLALSAFEEWFKEREGKLKLDKTNCSALQPESSRVIEAVCNLQVGEFKICLIATESLIDDLVRLPKVAVDNPGFAAHFYVVVEVFEEEEQAVIHSFLGYDRLQKAQESCQLTLDADGSVYALDFDWFKRDINHLLLGLRLGDPRAFDLPELAEKCEIPSSSGTPPLGSPPDLSAASTSQPPAAPKPKPSLLQPAINVALWLRNELGEDAERLNWEPPLPLVTASGFRFIQSFYPVLEELRNRGMEIPQPSYGSCRDIYLAGTALKLLAGTWELPQKSDSSAQEWSLLLILAMQSSSFLPQGIRLQVEDLTKVMYDKTMETEARYFVVRLEGNLDEQFTVTIELNGKTLSLEPFKFDPNESAGTTQTNLPHFRSIPTRQLTAVRLR